MSVDGGSSFGGSVGSANSRAEPSSGKGGAGDSVSSFWLGVYGVLYTVSKERKTSWTFFSIKYTLDLVQLFLLMFGNQYGWQYDFNNTMWKIMEILQVQPWMTTLGFTVFLVLMYVFAALLVINVAICVWTFYSFQNNNFAYVWPIQFLRIFGYIFYQVLDLMSLSLFLTACDCAYWDVDPALKYHNREFPDIKCWSMPYVIHFIVGVVSLVIFITLAASFIAAEMQLDPLTTNQDANAHSRVELTAFGIKAFMTVSQAFLSYKLLAIVWFVGAAGLAYLYWKWEPMVVEWVNYLRVGTYTSILYLSMVFLALQFPPDSVTSQMKTNPEAMYDYGRKMTFALVGMVPAFAFGALASYLRLRFFRVVVLNRFRTAPLKAKSRNLYQFTDAREVEILTRCCRKWLDADKEELDPAAVALAERVVLAGLQQLPRDPFMVIWYSSFLIDVQGSYQSGFAQLQVASKMNLSYLDKFAIFSREQEHTQKAGGGGRAGQATDLVTFVEYQKNYRLALNAHSEALLSLRYFWQLLLHAEVRFEDLTVAVRRIDKTISAAERVYRSVLKRHSDSARILRMYAKFLERVKHDPWNASHWTLEADKLEQQEEDDRHNNLLGLEEGGAGGGGGGGDNGPGGRVALFSTGPNGEERAVVVFNSHGVVVMANAAMRDMFGLSTNEFKGKNVTTILPQPFSEQLQKTLKAFVLAGRGSVVTRTAECVAIHKERHMFAVKITIVRISGVGEDSIFLASLERVIKDDSVATVWVLPSGRVLSVDHTFSSWFGYSPADLEGSATSALVVNQAKPLENLLRQAKFSMIQLSHAAHVAAAAKTADAEDGAFASVINNRVAGEKLAASSRSMKVSGRMGGMDAVSDALAQAAEDDGKKVVGGVWSLKELHIRHKYADAGAVDVSISNRGGTVAGSFCMHVLSLRRLDVVAEQPQQQPPSQMLVVSASGTVLHVTEGLATALGTTPKGLMANGSTSAMEAMMVQPFALLHRSGPGRGGQPMPPGPPPSYSCRSGLSVLMPVASGGALPFSFAMKRRQGLDEAYTVCTMQQNTWEQALDERSLSLVVDVTGVVRQVGASPKSLFGFDPATLVGRSAACCIDVLRSADGKGVTALLAELATRVDEVAGLSWRVGVGLQQDDDYESALLPALEARRGPLRPAVMTVVLQTPTQYVPPAVSLPRVGSTEYVTTCDNFDMDEDLKPTASATTAATAVTAQYGRCLELRLWRADLVTDVVELDGRGIVVETELHLQKLYPAGLALGASSARMVGHHIRNFIPLGQGRRFMDLFEDNLFPAVPGPDTKAAPLPGAAAGMAHLRRSSFRQQPGQPTPAGPPALLNGRHRGDGRDLQMAVQIVRKGNAGAYLVVHVHNASAGRVDLLDFLAQKRRRVSSSSSQLNQYASQELNDEAIKAARESGYVGVPSAGPSNVDKTMLARRSEAMEQPSITEKLMLGRRSAPVMDLSAFTSPVRHASFVVDDATARKTRFTGGGVQNAMAAAAAAAAASPFDAEMMAGGIPDVPVRLNVQRQAAQLREGGDSSDSEAGNDDGGSEDGDMALDDGAGQYPQDDVDAMPEPVEDAVTPFAPVVAAGGSSRRHRGPHAAGDSDADGADDVAIDSEDADYVRGQLHKRLVRMLESEQVQRHALRFKWHTLIVLAIVAGISIAIYFITKTRVDAQAQLVVNLYNTGQAARKMMRVATTTLDLCALYGRYPFIGLQPTLLGFTNNVADLASRLKFFKGGLAIWQANHVGTYLGFTKSEQLPTAYGLRALWETPSITEYDFLSVPLTEANATSAKGTSSIQIQVNTVSLYDLGNKMIARAQDILANGKAYNASLTGNAMWGNWTSVLYLMNNSDSTLLPGYMATLNGYSQVVIDHSNTVNMVHLVILVLEGCVLAAGCLAYMWWLTSKVDTMRYSVYSVFMVVPVGLIRNLASQRLNLAEDGESEEDDEEVNDMNKLKNDLASGGTTARAAATGKGVGKAAAPLVRSGSIQVATTGVLAMLMFWKRPAKPQQSERRRLQRSLRGVIWLCWPFAAWGAFVMMLNSISYAHLTGAAAPIMIFNVVSFLQLYTWHVTFGVSLMTYNQVGNNPDPNVMATLREGLVGRLALFRKEYTLLRYGRDALPLETSPHFRLVTAGLSNVPGYGQQLMYNTSVCLATPATAAVGTGCLAATDVFRPWTMHGLDAMIQRFMTVAGQISLNVGMDPSSASPEIAYIWKTRDSMLGAASNLFDSYKGQVMGIYTLTHQLQVAALCLSMVLVAFYTIFMLWPYLREVKSETRRITELLTQLPTEVDVERLVGKALLGMGMSVMPPPTKGKDRDGPHAPVINAQTEQSSLEGLINGGSSAGVALPRWLSNGSSMGGVKNKVQPSHPSDGNVSGLYSRTSPEDMTDEGPSGRGPRYDEGGSSGKGLGRPSQDSARPGGGGHRAIELAARTGPAAAAHLLAEAAMQRNASLSRTPLLQDEPVSPVHSPRVTSANRRASLALVPDVV